MTYKRKPTYVFTSDDLAAFIVVTSNLDASKYSDPQMKALIYKCKAATIDDDVVIRIAREGI